MYKVFTNPRVIIYMLIQIINKQIVGQKYKYANIPYYLVTLSLLIRLLKKGNVYVSEINFFSIYTLKITN